MLMLMLTPPRRSSGSDSGMGGEGGLSESELLESTNAPLTYFGELYYHLCLWVLRPTQRTFFISKVMTDSVSSYL